MTITAAQVKELRSRTDAPMMDCKKALQACNGDIDAAAEALRKAGQAKADKKADRTAAEGLITVASNEAGTLAAMLETNCETDFVARDENFVAFSNETVQTALDQKIADRDALLKANLSSGATVEEGRTSLIAKIGENVNVRRILLLDAGEGHIGAYVHGGRIGVLLAMKGGDAALAKDLAMHVAACNPSVVSPEDVSQELIDKEQEIYTAQAQESGKPAEIIEKMIQGRLRKFRDEVSLLGQPFVKDSGSSVASVLKAAKAEVISFTRFEVGEGIEKKKDDFVKEVMEQAQGSTT
jgi:elongation factor Ts